MSEVRDIESEWTMLRSSVIEVAARSHWCKAVGGCKEEHLGR